MANFIRTLKIKKLNGEFDSLTEVEQFIISNFDGLTEKENFIGNESMKFYVIHLYRNGDNIFSLYDVGEFSCKFESIKNISDRYGLNYKETCDIFKNLIKKQFSEFFNSTSISLSLI